MTTTASIHPTNATPTPAARDFASDARRPRDILVETRSNGDASATASIASISDQDWHISRTHGVYHIPACAKGEPYALVVITSRGDALDQDLREHGIFVCAGERPTAEELASATTRRDAYYHQLVAEGDTMWARGHSFREISDLHRRAAIALGVEREWAYVPTRFADCPACGEKVKPGVAVCKHCGAILDAEKAAKHGLGGGSANASAPTNANTSPANASNAAPRKM